MSYRKGITFTSAFQKLLDKPKHKLNKILVDKGRKFCNRSIKSILQNKNIKMYSTHNEGKSVVAERFLRTLKDKIYKFMTSIFDK